MSEATKGKPPVETIRFGRTQAAIWERTGKNGTFYGVTVTRTYQQDGTLKNSSEFSGADILEAALAMQEAYVAVRNLQAEAKKA